jgi:hypothetical protein
MFDFSAESAINVGRKSEVELMPVAATKPTVADQIRALAESHNVTYQELGLDRWANKVTALAGDKVELDDIEELLIALKRNGVLTNEQMTQFQIAYLREI